MRKYYFNPKAPRGLYEVEVSSIISFALRPGEALYKISSPSIFENEEWYSWAFQDSLNDCRIHAWYAILREYEAVHKKLGKEFSIEDVKSEHDKLEVFKL